MENILNLALLLIDHNLRIMGSPLHMKKIDYLIFVLLSFAKDNENLIIWEPSP